MRPGPCAQDDFIYSQRSRHQTEVGKLKQSWTQFNEVIFFYLGCWLTAPVPASSKQQDISWKAGLGVPFFLVFRPARGVLTSRGQRHWPRGGGRGAVMGAVARCVACWPPITLFCSSCNSTPAQISARHHHSEWNQIHTCLSRRIRLAAPRTFSTITPFSLSLTIRTTYFPFNHSY